MSALANAQTVEVSALEQCAALESQAEKLACFEAIVAESQDDEDSTAEPTVVPSDTQPVDSAPAIATETKAPAVASEAETGQATTSARGVEAAAAPAAATTVTPAAPTQATEAAALDMTAETRQSGNPDDEFGRDHLRSDAEASRDELLRARVIEVRKTRHGALIFYLDNGQVWQQMEPRYYPYPKGREFDVEISKGMMGEYRLQVESVGRKVTIRRMK